MRRVELARLFTRIGGKHADEIFVDQAEHVVTLPVIHGDVLDELEELADSLGLLCGGISELA